MAVVFAIPVATSSLTHVVTCKEDVTTPFTLIVSETGQATLLSSVALSRERPTLEVCDGLTLNMRASSEGGGLVRMTLPITNTSRYTWKGTVRLLLAGTSIPFRIGEIKPGSTATDSVEISVPRGTHELSGSLLVGP